MCERNGRRGPGSLFVIGLGPGDCSLLPPLAVQALETAQVVVGYTKYIELLDARFLDRKEVVSTGMRGEVERCARAVESALEGKNTAVVSSGDAGIYAMAGLVFEMLDQRGLSESVPVEVVPGIPAFVAAAALLGAPLTHDFACVSLSDLLTPWEVIEKRLKCAAEGDFVIGLYNPRSRKRDIQLPRAMEIIGEFREPAVPVGLVTKAFRPGQTVQVTSLKEFDPAEAGMQSLVLVGNSSSRMYSGLGKRNMYTPRGYAGKYALREKD